MRTKIEQAKKIGADAIEKLKPMATDAKNTIVAGVKVVQESPEAERLVAAVNGSSAAKELLGVLAFSGASAAISPIVTWAACTDDNGTCSTSMAKTFVTTAVVAGGALYGAKKYMPSLFAKKAVLEEQALVVPPSSPTSPRK